MPQIYNGILVGAVEGVDPARGPLTYVFNHVGLPADNPDPNVALSSPGSLYIRVDVPALYQKQTDGTWKVATFS